MNNDKGLVYSRKIPVAHIPIYYTHIKMTNARSDIEHRE